MTAPFDAGAAGASRTTSVGAGAGEAGRMRFRATPSRMARHARPSASRVKVVGSERDAGPSKGLKRISSAMGRSDNFSAGLKPRPKVSWLRGVVTPRVEKPI